MQRHAGGLLFWAPRILCLLLALWLGVFALDVFGEGYGFWETVLALLLHLIPTALVLGILALAWRWEWVGAVVFALLGLFYAGWAGGEHWAWIAFISGPLFLVALLFWLNWRRSPRRQATS